MESDTNTEAPAESPVSIALRRQLRERGWTQRELSEFLGKHESTVSLWLSGQNSPRSTDALVSRLAEFLGQSAEEVEALLAEGGMWGSKASDLERIGTLEQFNSVCWQHPSVIPLFTSAHLKSDLAIVNRFRERGYEVDSALVQTYLNQRIKGRRKLGILTEQVLGTPAGQEFLSAPPDESLEAFRIAFRRDGWIRATICAVCERLDRAFSNTETERLAETPLLRIIDECLGHDDSPEHEESRDRIVRALVDALVWVRYLEPEVRKGGVVQYRRCWRLSAAYLTNRLFGVTPQVAGLDFLLDGALLPPTRSGLTLLLEGEPGTGKTTLSLQLAASLASQGYAVVYLSAEEDPVTLEECLGFTGYDTRRRDEHRTVLARRHEDSDSEFNLRTANSTDAILRFTQGDPGHGESVGSVTIASIADRDSAFHAGDSELLGNLQTIFNDLNARGVPTCLVVDSIDAVLPDAKRREVEDVFNFGRYHTDVCVVVTEAGRTGSPRATEYLADMVISLGYRARLEWFSERVIEIRKCRTQAHIRGQHMFSIHTGGGITIYPSIQSKLSVWRRRIRRSRVPRPESWRLDDQFDYDPILKGDLCRGDAILVTGEPATHKFPLGLSFLAAGLHGPAPIEGNCENLLLISLREDEATIRLISDNYPQLRRLTEALDSESARPRLRVLHFPPDYFSAERILHWIERTLREMRRGGERVSRVLFNSLGQLRFNSPMFSKEPLLVAALIELFKKEGITSLFISVGAGQFPLFQVSEREGAQGNAPVVVAVGDGGSQEIGNIFDTIIFTGKRLGRGQKEEIVLSVGHTGKCNATRDPVVLKRPTVSDPDAPEGWIGRLELDTGGA